MEDRERSLADMCAVWADCLRLAGPLGPDSDWPVTVPAARASASISPDFWWTCDGRGRIVRMWTAKARDDTHVLRARITEEMLSIGAASGPIKLAGRTVLFARAELPGVGSGGHLWLARVFDAALLKAVGAGAGGELVFVNDSPLPDSAGGEDTPDRRFWRKSPDELAVAWVVHDPAGRSLGYLQATVGIEHVHRQAVAARRMVLIILSLSVGLILLVILGAHVLIAGPVCRLMSRLRAMEIDGHVAKELTKNLHGEPLVLARRLESAFDKLAHMSKTDELTGLANRRHFTEVLNAFYHQARRYNRPLSVIQLDVDFFKAVNDTCGHQGGDELLQCVAREIELACRKADLPARNGGDEFAVLLPETPASEAGAVAERIRQAVAASPVTIRDVGLNVSVSIGISDLNAGEIDGPDTMLALADQALYAAKELGRNRIVQAHDLGGVTWQGADNGKKVDTLHRKLAGLDSKFRGLFLQAIEEVIEVLEQRDPDMADHAVKVRHYAVMIAREMELPDRVIERIETAAMLHDIGMLAMPDSILLCPGDLDEHQLRIMRRHPLLSVRIMEGMEFLEQEIPAVRYHHERYDGKGYPEGIAGAAIPLSARILAVAEAFVGIVSSQTFRTTGSLSEALAELRNGSGAQFDPIVIEAFLCIAEREGEGLLEVPELPERRHLDDQVPSELLAEAPSGQQA